MGYVDRRPSSCAPFRSCSPARTSSAARRPAPARPPRSPCPFSPSSASTSPRPRVLILEPTRELAAQVETAIRDFARFTNLRIAVVLRRRRLRPAERTRLRAGVDIIVATPGRLLDHLEQGTLRLDKVQFLVLDEADRMLDMGFLPDVRRIVRKMPARSATPRCFPPPFRRRSKRSSNGRCTIRRRLRSARAARPPKRSSTSSIPCPIRRKPTCCSSCSSA